MKKVILTGGTGFIGANLARRLLRDGHQVHFFVRKGYQPWRIEEIRQDIVLYELDLQDQAQLEKALKQIGPDWIFHLAAYGSSSTQKDWRQMVEANIVGTISLVEAALKIGFQAFIHIGSSSEYGWKDHAPAEAERLDPNSPYALTKASATMFCRYTAIDRKANVITLRPYSIFGPYEDFGRFMPTLIVKGLDGSLPPLVNPNVARDFLYVDDFVEACILAATRADQEPGSIYNCGTGVQSTIQEVVRLAKGVLSIVDEPKWGSMENKIWDTHVWVSDSRRIQKVLGWCPRHDLEKGFKCMVSWFKDNPLLLKSYKKVINAGEMQHAA